MLDIAIAAYYHALPTFNMNTRRIDSNHSGETLAEFLNRENVSAALAGLKDLIQALRALPDQWRHAPDLVARHKLEIWFRLEQALDRWRIRFSAVSDPKKKGKVTIDWFPDLELAPDLGDDEWHTFTALLNIVRADELHRLNVCPRCKKWFFAAQRAGKIYCSTPCRQAAFDATPKRKKYHKQLAKKIYDKLFPKKYRRNRRTKARKQRA